METSSIILTIIIGGLAGWAATAVFGAKRAGILLYIILGIVGAFIGNGVIGMLGFEHGGGLLADFIVAFIGAGVLLLIAGLVSRLFVKS